MPKKPVDYSKMCIYKLEHIDKPELVYVGSTTDMTKRKTAHKFDTTNPKSKKYNQKKYEMIRANGGWESFRMLLVEKYPCSDSHEARRREAEVMKELKCNMNSISPFTSEEDRKIQKSKSNAIYRQNNRQIINEYKKEYYETNKQSIREKQNNYYENNKQILNEKQNVKIQCECGCISTRTNIAKHRKTKIHLNNMQKLEYLKEQNGIEYEINSDSDKDEIASDLEE